MGDFWVASVCPAQGSLYQVFLANGTVESQNCSDAGPVALFGWDDCAFAKTSGDSGWEHQVPYDTCGEEGSGWECPQGCFLALDPIANCTCPAHRADPPTAPVTLEDLPVSLLASVDV